VKSFDGGGGVEEFEIRLMRTKLYLQVCACKAIAGVSPACRSSAADGVVDCACTCGVPMLVINANVVCKQVRGGKTKLRTD